jgi:transcriptional regulator with XRE-family HTH domain
MRYKGTMNALGDFLRKRRAQLGLSQDELAERISFSQPYYSRIETGAVQMPGADKRRGIAAALGPATWIF